jgi:hypothetical protein
MNTIFTLILVLVLAGIVALVSGSSILPVFAASLRHKRLLRKGILADATVLSVTQTGFYRNNRLLLKLEVQVHPDTGRSFIAEAKHLLDFIEIPHLGCGRKVEVKYNPLHPKRVALLL